MGSLKISFLLERYLPQTKIDTYSSWPVSLAPRHQKSICVRWADHFEVFGCHAQDDIVETIKIIETLMNRDQLRGSK